MTDEELKIFLIKIMQSVYTVLLWLLVCMLFGVYKKYAFFTGSPGWQNILFYGLFILSGIAIYLHLRKKWKR
ncbi:MAG: hypothetical protein IPP48_09320 [Chitinophagaceae bacterium]|nr:hypothetical protein [Chitinophagaceae bacterium]